MVELGSDSLLALWQIMVLQLTKGLLVKQRLVIWRVVAVSKLLVGLISKVEMKKVDEMSRQKTFKIKKLISKILGTLV